MRPGKLCTVTVLASSTSAEPERWRFTVDSVVCGKPLDPTLMAYATESVGVPTTARRPSPANSSAS